MAYPAFDAAVGVGSGVVLSGLGPLSADGMAVIEPALRALFWGPVTGLMAIVAAGAWVIALGAAAWIESAGARWRGAPRPA